MTSERGKSFEQFREAVTEAASLLKDVNLPNTRADSAAGSLPTLLDECNDLCEKVGAETEEPVRVIHHFACTGGTLISKCLAAMPNVELLSEIDPLSDLREGTGMPYFAPTDILYLLRYSARGIGQRVVLNVFLATMSSLHEELRALGRRLVVRDHTHSHFCVKDYDPSRPTLGQTLASKFPLRSITTVRDPLDSFLSLSKNGWLHFSPQTFDEYCARYLLFIDSYTGTPVYRYEDFVQEPERLMQEMCNSLSLAYDPAFVSTFEVVRLTGDSGRSGGEIGTRKRREIPDALRMQAKESLKYSELCERLGYEQQA